MRWLIGLAVIAAAAWLWSAAPGSVSGDAQESREAASTQPLPGTDPGAASESAARRRPQDPLDLIPAESLAVWKSIPIPGEPRHSELQTGSTFIDLIRRVVGAGLDARAKLTLRIYEMINLARDYRFAVACIDASARSTRPDGGGTHADRLKIVFVAETGGDSLPFLRIVGKTVQELTDAGAATLEKKTVAGVPYQELHDTRLPDWCRVAWGNYDGYFVLTLGDDVWPQIVAVAGGEQPSIGTDPWVRQRRAATRDEPLVEIIAATRRIREQLDPFVMNRATGVFRAWGADDIDQMHWAIGFRGPSLYCRATFREGESTTSRVLADAAYRDERLARTIPEESRYAVFRLSAAQVLTRIVNCYYAAQSEEEYEEAARRWRQIQRELGFDAQRDVLDRLGESIVMHNYPRHPLRVPMMFTALYEIESEGPAVAATLDRLCAAWLEAIQRALDEAGDTAPPVLRRDADGVWYLQLGPVSGLAWIFTDRFIITSWSPTALRDYLSKVPAEVVGRPAAAGG